MRRSLQIQREGDELRKVMTRIFTPVRGIPIAHRLERRLCFFGVAQIPLDLGAYVQTLRVGPVQVRVIAASVHRGEDGEQRLARVQGDGSILRSAQRRQQAE